MLPLLFDNVSIDARAVDSPIRIGLPCLRFRMMPSIKRKFGAKIEAVKITATCRDFLNGIDFLIHI